ncbi:TIGR03013 family XrtA/PEP-CTERM system glycosyltransferase [Kordiimonas lacus]|uniref:Sugar transferase, PEP-CTERM system associated/exopolysaccharide biosynthesis polyprenyl glycosylphosphotransferase n=1 Tax=Kordiimonas lacus TaxID=637679 RepID=A0A1G6W2Q5_9PROT|nr:TIGR03013 family XrtA/PEP-CTERM system glycosyltransferase [Kordiimonas lacus]SDD59517.1 sugar transferase, PEP-CTERM system associated/exopolysaccharide biosynthesis polyprenyl glycosylphosphotransferase [Kordiimonas lacus]
MVRIFRHYVSPIKLGLAAIDFLLILGASIGAEWLRYWSLDLTGAMDLGLVGWAAKGLLPTVSLPVLIGVGVYQSESLTDFRVFWVRLAVGLLIGALVAAAVLFLVPTLPLWRSIMVLAIVLSSTFLMIARGIFMAFGSPDFLGRRVLILGAGKTAQDLMQYTERAREAGINIVRTVALPNEQILVQNAVKLEDISMLDEFAKDNHIEMIIVTQDGASAELPLEALIACKLAGIEVKDRLTCYEQIRGYVDVSSVSAEWIIFSDGFQGATALESAGKRILDLTVSLLFGLLVSPLLIAAAIAIKLTSRGPVFYLQERAGLNGKTFRLVKLRSMRVDAETQSGPQWAEEKDPRITPIGAFLRQSRLDEMPQLWNVFKGDMSFVGPRPERPFFVDQLEQQIPFFRERHCVKPGMTGWAQIRYPYGASVEDAKRKLEYDLYYIKNYSLFLDLLIIIQTVRVVLFPAGVR